MTLCSKLGLSLGHDSDGSSCTIVIALAASALLLVFGLILCCCCHWGASREKKADSHKASTVVAAAAPDDEQAGIIAPDLQDIHIIREEREPLEFRGRTARQSAGHWRCCDGSAKLPDSLTDESLPRPRSVGTKSHELPRQDGQQVSLRSEDGYVVTARGDGQLVPGTSKDGLGLFKERFTLEALGDDKEGPGICALKTSAGKYVTVNGDRLVAKEDSGASSRFVIVTNSDGSKSLLNKAGKHADCYAVVREGQVHVSKSGEASLKVDVLAGDGTLAEFVLQPIGNALNAVALQWHRWIEEAQGWHL